MGWEDKDAAAAAKAAGWQWLPTKLEFQGLGRVDAVNLGRYHWREESGAPFGETRPWNNSSSRLAPQRKSLTFSEANKNDLEWGGTTSLLAPTLLEQQ
jgi:hypothetical protein